jgi:hypothetical protein
MYGLWPVFCPDCLLNSSAICSLRIGVRSSVWRSGSGSGASVRLKLQDDSHGVRPVEGGCEGEDAAVDEKII